jgi:hypothetical protein
MHQGEMNSSFRASRGPGDLAEDRLPICNNNRPDDQNGQRADEHDVRAADARTGAGRAGQAVVEVNPVIGNAELGQPTG